MTNVEVTGWRDQAYSEWHRTLPDSLGFIDIDWIEWCSACFKRLAVYELAVDNGKNDTKKCSITRGIASALGVKGFLVLYRKDRYKRIDRFRVRELAPVERNAFTTLTPDEWADRLYALRWCHPVSKRRAPLPAPVPVARPARECPSCHRMHPAGTTCSWAESA